MKLRSPHGVDMISSWWIPILGKVLFNDSAIARTELLHYRSKSQTSIVGHVLLALVLAMLLYQSASPIVLWTWLAVHLLVCVIRMLNLHTFQQDSYASGSYQWWAVALTVGPFATACVWGAGFFLFFEPADPIVLFAISLAAIGMISASALASASFLPSFLFFSPPLALLYIAVCLLHANTLTLTMASFMVIYLAVLTFVSASFSREHRELIRLRNEKQKFAESLHEQKEQAELAVLEKNRFLAATSHDLRQPLHAATMLVGALQSSNEPSHRESLLSSLETSLASLSNAFSSLLDLSKLDADVVTINKKPLDLAQLVAEIVEEIAPSAQAKGLELNVELIDRSWVISDPIHLQRIVRNLLLNAVQYTQVGAINVELSYGAEQAVLAVKDTGIGIAKENLSAVFNEYFQVANPERDASRGLGLGLAIVKKLCDLLGHSIRVVSEQHEGSEFVLELPSAETLEQNVNESNPASVLTLAGTRVMLIDDDVNVLAATEQLLLTWQCEVSLAENLADALPILDGLAEPPDIFLIDYRLRDHVTGVDVYKELSSTLDGTVPLIILTGDTSPERLQQLRDSGYWVLHKPLAVTELRAAIQQALATN